MAFTRFGQELYVEETVLAASIVVGAESLSATEITTRIASALPHRSPGTRRRVAVKLLQRLMAAATAAPPVTGGASGPEQKPTPRAVANFARLVCCTEDPHARSELVYYAACRGDALVGAIAKEILYPYFIEDRIPPPFTEDEFISANTNLLLVPEPVLTCGFVCDFARRVWGFDSDRTITLVLRILKQAGLLMTSSILGDSGRMLAYTLSPHGIELPALMWGLYYEFGNRLTAPAWDQVGRASVARMFLAQPIVIASKLHDAERQGLVGIYSGAGMRRVHFKTPEPEALTRLLVGTPAENPTAAL